MADFEMAQIDFRFASRQQPYLGASGGESDGQTLSDSAPGTGYQNRHFTQSVHTLTLLHCEEMRRDEPSLDADVHGRAVVE